MDVRLTIKTTPGRPLRGVAVMSALLALAALAAWAVARYKSRDAVQLADRVHLGTLPLALRPPAGWQPLTRIADPHPNLIGAFAESDEEGMTIRRLYVYRITAEPVDPDTLLSVLFRGYHRRVERSEPARLGPLAGRQMVFIVPSRERLAKEIVRTAVLGSGQYLVLQLTCLGPPTRRELETMERVAESVELTGPAARGPNDLTDQSGIELTASAGEWLAEPAGEPTRDIILLPTAPGGALAGTFWGSVRLRAGRVDPQTDLGELLLRQTTGQSLQDRLVESLLGRRPAAAKAEILQIGPVPAWRIRTSGGGVVRVDYLFRPLAGAATTQPAGELVADQAVRLTGWYAASDERAAVAAIDKLIPSIRLP